MSNFFLFTEHIILLQKLLFNPDSFVIYYDQIPRASRVGSHWCFVDNLKETKSTLVSDKTCEELVFHKILVPEIDDAEFQAQRAVGTQNGRIYKISKKFEKIFDNKLNLNNK